MQILYLKDLKMPNYKNEILHVVIDKKKIKKQFYKKNLNVFTFNKYVLNQKERKNINHFYPDPQKTALKAETILLDTYRYKKSIVNEIMKIDSLKVYKNANELIDPFLEVKISRFLYLKDVIPFFKNYVLIRNKKKEIFSNKLDLILAIDEYYSSNKKKIISYTDKFSISNKKFYNGFLLKIQSFFIKNIYKRKGKDVVFFSDKEAYFINYLKSKYLNQRKIVFYFCSSNSLIRIILLLIDQLIKLFFWKKCKEVGIFLLPQNKSFLKSKEVEINNNNFDPKYFSYLKTQIYSNLETSINFSDYIYKTFRGLKIKNSFFHSTRGPDLFALSNVLSCLNKNVSLISHGSHTFQFEKDADIIASFSN